MIFEKMQMNWEDEALYYISNNFPLPASALYSLESSFPRAFIFHYCKFLSSSLIPCLYKHLPTITQLSNFLAIRCANLEPYLSNANPYPSRNSALPCPFSSCNRASITWYYLSNVSFMGRGKQRRHMGIDWTNLQRRMRISRFLC